MNTFSVYSNFMGRMELALNGAGTSSLLGSIGDGETSYDCRKIVIGEGNPRRVLISAAIHGDEPAGAEAVCEFVRSRLYEPYLDRWEFTILPCLNPTGFDRGKRENFQGKDLNRLFKSSSPPNEVLFAQSVFQRGYPLTLELHEDTESAGYYLYQKISSRLRAGPGGDILNVVRGVMPINMEKDIDGVPASGGLIDRLKGPDEMDWWPMALYALSKGTDCCLTLETATCFPMDLRVQAHLKAVQTALAFFDGTS